MAKTLTTGEDRRSNGLASYNGDFVFNLRDGVDWGRYLRVIGPCTTTQGTC